MPKCLEVRGCSFHFDFPLLSANGFIITATGISISQVPSDYYFKETVYSSSRCPLDAGLLENRLLAVSTKQMDPLYFSFLEVAKFCWYSDLHLVAFTMGKRFDVGNNFLACCKRSCRWCGQRHLCSLLFAFHDDLAILLIVVHLMATIFSRFLASDVTRSPNAWCSHQMGDVHV